MSTKLETYSKTRNAHKPIKLKFGISPLVMAVPIFILYFPNRYTLILSALFVGGLWLLQYKQISLAMVLRYFRTVVMGRVKYYLPKKRGD